MVLAANPLSELFEKAGFSRGKNFIELRTGRTVLEESLFRNLNSDGLNLCLVPVEEFRSGSSSSIGKNLSFHGLDVEFVPVPKTKSAIHTLLWASDFLNNSPLRIIPGDAIIFDQPWVKPPDNSEMIVTNGFEDRWGFVEVSEGGMLADFKAKTPFSNTISTGFYYFRNGVEVFEACEELVTSDLGNHREVALHIGDIARILSFGQPIETKFIEPDRFLPMASPGDVRRALSSPHFVDIE